MEIRGGPNGQVRVSCKEANRADIVLRWVEDGLTSCEDIAREMGLSKGTVSKLASKLCKARKLKKNGREYALIGR